MIFWRVQSLQSCHEKSVDRAGDCKPAVMGKAKDMSDKDGGENKKPRKRQKVLPEDQPRRTSPRKHAATVERRNEAGSEAGSLSPATSDVESAPLSHLTDEQMDEKIAEFLEGHPEFYDRGHARYKDKARKEALVKTFALSLGSGWTREYYLL